MDELDDAPTQTIFKPVPSGMTPVPNLLELLSEQEQDELSAGGWEFMEARPDFQPSQANGYTFVFQRMTAEQS